MSIAPRRPSRMAKVWDPASGEEHVVWTDSAYPISGECMRDDIEEAMRELRGYRSLRSRNAKRATAQIVKRFRETAAGTELARFWAERGYDNGSDIVAFLAEASSRLGLHPRHLASCYVEQHLLASPRQITLRFFSDIVPPSGYRAAVQRALDTWRALDGLDVVFLINEPL